MRTKTLLLTAAALLAAGIVSSQAQPVYSQNIVGYATIVTPGNGATYYSMAVPFVIGASNGANEIFGTTLPDVTSILTWNGSGYNTVVYDGHGNFAGVNWYTDQGEGTAAVIPVLKPGQGFFLQPGPGSLTNTFVGTVAVNVGSSTNMSLPGNGATYYSLGSIIPFAGFVTNAIALTNLPDVSSVLTWNGSGYNTVVYDAHGNFAGVNWYTDQGEGTAAACPVLSVGQGFFLQPGPGAYTWTQTLPSN